MIATLNLNPAIDKIVSLQNLRWGEHLLVKRIKQVAAGKGISVARAIKRLGGDVVIIGFVGGANGEWIKDELKKEKLKFDFVPMKGKVRENLTIMDERRAREIHLREEGPIIKEGELALLKNRLKKWSPLLKFLVISGRPPKGVPVNFYKEIISFFKKKRIPVLLDSNGPAFKRALRAVPDYIKPNLIELEELAGGRLRGRSEKIRFIKGLIQQGINMVVLTNGPGKVLAMSSNQGLVFTPPKICARNTVGSGDSVTGALAYGLTNGLGYEKMLKLAIACGSANTLSIGAGLFDIIEVRRLLRKINVKVLYNHCN